MDQITSEPNLTVEMTKDAKVVTVNLTDQEEGDLKSMIARKVQTAITLEHARQADDVAAAHLNNLIWRLRHQRGQEKG